jgi:hypothetical protein
MKNMKLKIAIGSALFVALWTAQTASAWYDPATQRWLNRDPKDEPGFQLIQKVGPMGHATNPTSQTSGRWITREAAPEYGDINLYCMVQNNPIIHVDPFGLKLWKCTRNTHWKFDGTAQHVYLWDDKSKSSCGRGGGNPFRGKGVYNRGYRGPGTENHTCVEIPGSEGKESTVMDCCKTPRYGFFSVWLNDCHNWVDDCLDKNGLPSPSVYGRFWGLEDVIFGIFK